MNLTRIPLENTFVRLEPIAESHREGLRAGAGDPAIWAHFPRNGSANWDQFFDTSLEEHARGVRIYFTAFDKTQGDRPVGQTAFLEIRAPHDGVEIGATWYEPATQGGAVNPACKFLLLDHAFACGAERVELKTDILNKRSQAAILKLGAQFEGVHRSHMRRRDGTMRDTSWYSIIREEWPAVRAKLEQRLEAFKA
jgi:RimJ/RimL family protein N-acetyltransferase